jgi:hypothetical protein
VSSIFSADNGAKRRGDMQADRLKAGAADRGYGLATTDLGVVEVVRKKPEDRRDSGMIDAAFFAEDLSKLRFLFYLSSQNLDNSTPDSSYYPSKVKGEKP